MARRVFFSFHYQRDVWRVNQMRSIPNVTKVARAGFSDASLWEQMKSQSEDYIKRKIREALANTSVTVVCLGYETAKRPFVNYEIDQSIQRGNGILAVRINHFKDNFGRVDQMGPAPKQFTDFSGYKVYTYQNYHKLGHWIELAARDAGH